MLTLFEIRVGEIEEGYLPVEVWRTVSKSATDQGHTSQQVANLLIPVEIPVRD